MFGYIIAFLAVGLFWADPILRLFSQRQPSSSLRRTPRPAINETLLAVELNASLGCAVDAYSVHVFSRDPLVLYVENFLSEDERSHLLEISNPIFEASTITHDGGDSAHRDTTVRDSEVALIPRTEAVQCIESRARALQGWRDEVWVERLRVQRYGAGGHYSHHFDWSSSRGGWGRVSSFMVWVDDGSGGLEGGGTEFPLLRRRTTDERWCRFVECGETVGNGEDNSTGSEGVVFKVMPGNAVFWENFRPDGSGKGYDETWHAGLPVTSGTKVGLNIWSWGRID